MGGTSFYTLLWKYKEAVGCFVVVFVGLVAFCVYRKTRRVSHVEDLARNCVGRKLCGVVTSVADGDGFRFFHTPWLRRKWHTPADGKLYIRLAGVDAPEIRHYHVPEQPFANEAREYLRKLVLNKRVKIEIAGIDRYNRVLAIVKTCGWFSGKNVNVEMVRCGYACVYEGRDAVYGEHEAVLREAQKDAMKRKCGMWSLADVVTPMEYKKTHSLRRIGGEL